MSRAFADTGVQRECLTLIQAALHAGQVPGAVTGLAGYEPGEAYFGAYADFSADRARRVHCYRDDDGAVMIDAMDAEVGIPAPMPYSHGLLIAYLTWASASGGLDQAFLSLAQASSPVAL